MSRIQVTVVTGFLGSGKTTLLNALLKHPRMAQAAVIVNEFGEIGLDYDLIERSDETVIQLENGCLCCTVKSDLIDTLRDLYLQRKGGLLPAFERVVIETTGIADPGPVLQIVLTDPLVSAVYELDGVVTTLDAINGDATLQAHAESVKQVAIADRLVLTKTDLVDDSPRRRALAGLRARLQALNPGAPVIEAVSGRFDPEVLFGDGLAAVRDRRAELEQWLGAAAVEGEERAGFAMPEGHHHDLDSPYRAPSNHDPAIRSFCVVREPPLPIDTLRLFLEAIGREAGPDLLRVKGIIHVAEKPDTPAVIQGAQHIFHSLEWLERWPSDDRRSRIVFITRGIDRAHIEDSLALIERVARRTAQAASRPY